MNFRNDIKIIAFVAAAREYCLTLEADYDNAGQWIETILSALSKVYARANDMPEVSVVGAPDFEDESVYVSHEDCEKIRGAIGLILGSQRYYRELFGSNLPVESNDESGMRDIADDLTDIYCGLKPGLRIWDKGDDVLIPMIFFDSAENLFYSHWGYHAVSAMRVLHHICYGRGIR